jgi:hypothetical protein
MKLKILFLIICINFFSFQKAHSGLAIMGTGGALTVSGSLTNSNALNTVGVSTTLIGAIMMVTGLKVSNIQMVLLDENTQNRNKIVDYLRSELGFIDNQELLVDLANSALMTHLESENELSTIYFSNETIEEIILREELNSQEAQKIKLILAKN